jgi:hypothetical protein
MRTSDDFSNLIKRIRAVPANELAKALQGTSCITMDNYVSRETLTEFGAKGHGNPDEAGNAAVRGSSRRNGR